MKIFFYKSILVFFLFLLGFHFSFNFAVKSVKREFENVISKEQAEILKLKIKNEMNKALAKNEIIKKEDAQLINKFINKIIADLNNKKQN